MNRQNSQTTLAQGQAVSARISVQGGLWRAPKYVLYVLLMLALVWLPMANLSAAWLVVVGTDANADAAVSLDVGNEHGAPDGSVMQHSSHHHSSSGVASVMHATDMPSGDCTGHQDPCCHASVSFYNINDLASVSVTLLRVDRYRQFTDSLVIVALPRAIRPPIV